MMQNIKIENRKAVGKNQWNQKLILLKKISKFNKPYP